MAVDYLDGGVLTDGDAYAAAGSVLLSSDTATVAFTSGTEKNNWSQYTDLFVTWSARGDASQDAANVFIKVNDDNGNNSTQYCYANAEGTSIVKAFSATEYKVRCGQLPCENKPDYVFSAGYVWFYDFNSGKYKYSHQRFSNDSNTSTNSSSGWFSGIYRKWDPIIKLEFSTDGGDFMAGSRFDVFGLLPRMVQ